MAVENKVSKRIEEISGSIISEVIRYRDNRIKDLEELETAMLQSDKTAIKSRLDRDTNIIRENITQLLSESESLVESFRYGEKRNDQNEKRPHKDIEINPIFPDQSSQNQMYSFGQSISNNEPLSNMTQVYERVQNELKQARYQPAFKEPDKRLDFEFVVMDTIANKDYPEKKNDLRILSMMSTPNISIAQTIEDEGWPALQAGMNLKAAKYIPDHEKAALSIQWLKAEKVDLAPQKTKGIKP
ncbi:MAG: hypothetical protein RR614_10475 [Eubacterium sp.]